MGDSGMFGGMDDSDNSPAGTGSIARDRVAYKIADAAVLLSLSRRKVEYLVAQGEIASFKIGGSRRIAGEEILAFVARQKGNAA